MRKVSCGTEKQPWWSYLYISTRQLPYLCHKSTEAVALGPNTYGWAYPAGEPGLVRISIGVDGIIFMFDGIILQTCDFQFGYIYMLGTQLYHNLASNANKYKYKASGYAKQCLISN